MSPPFLLLLALIVGPSGAVAAARETPPRRTVVVAAASTSAAGSEEAEAEAEAAMVRRRGRAIVEVAVAPDASVTRVVRPAAEARRLSRGAVYQEAARAVQEASHTAAAEAAQGAFDHAVAQKRANTSPPPAHAEGTAKAEWLVYLPGQLPIVLSVPHNGDIKPSDIDPRQHGCVDATGACIWSPTCTPRSELKCAAETLADSYTQEMALKMSDQFFKVTGKRPHVIINQLHRSYLDANRPEDEASGGIPDMVAAYRQFMSKAAEVRDAVSRSCGPSLWVDVHGHTVHDHVMLGYDVSGSAFSGSTVSESYEETATIRHLSESFTGSFDALLRGGTSLGTFMMKEGIDTTPSQLAPRPLSVGSKYLEGATIVDNFGSKTRGNVDAVQMEIPSKWRFGEAGSTGSRTEAHAKYAEHVVEAVLEFFQATYGFDVKGGQCCSPSDSAWFVSGGMSTGGLKVREGESTSSSELEGQLAHGALVKRVRQSGNRLQYEKCRGAGPATGWVTIDLNGAPLVKPASQA